MKNTVKKKKNRSAKKGGGRKEKEIKKLRWRREEKWASKFGSFLCETLTSEDQISRDFPKASLD